MMPSGNFYTHWVPGVTIDDQMWHQSLVIDCVLELLRGSEQGSNDVMMWMLLQWGILDPANQDKVWDSTVCCIQYLAVIGCCLWGLLAGERTRISLCQGHSTLTLPVHYSAPSQGQLVQLAVLTW